MNAKAHIMAAATLCVAAACGSGEGEAPDEARAPGAAEVWMLEELGPPVVTSMGVGTGDVRVALEVESMGFAYELDVEGETGRMALSYTHPPVGEDAAFDRSAIVVVGDDGVMTRVACEDERGVWCSYPAWAGGKVWYSESGARVEEGVDSVVSRVDPETGTIDARIAWATEPAAAPGGERVVWIGVNPETGARRLELGDEGGAVVRTLVQEGEHEDIGQPFFSADGAHVYYVAVWSVWSYVDVLTSFFVAEAHAHSSHDVPGDWWRISVDGGEPEQVTDLDTIHYDGRPDPGGEWIWVATREGVRRVHVETGEVVLERATRVVRALEVR